MVHAKYENSHHILPRHLEICSFLASLCKVCGILERGVIPPNVNLKTLNPSIRWREYRLRVLMEPELLRTRSQSGRPLVAMTSSGIGGANGHVVIEGAPPQRHWRQFWSERSFSRIPVLLVAGGLSPRSAIAVGEALSREMDTRDRVKLPFFSLGRTLGRRARSMTWRSWAVVGGGAPDMLPDVAPRFSDPILSPKTRPPIVFVFSGQGSQHFNSTSVCNTKLTITHSKMS